MLRPTIALTAILALGAVPAFAGAEGAWEETREETKDAYEATEEGAEEAWEETKEESKDAYEATREGTAEAWEETKEGAEEMGDEMEEAE